MADAYPAPYALPRNPIGWFAVGLSHELAKGQVREVAAVGRNLVLFRGESGEVGLLDAYCPHLGANIGAGGVVDGECVRCPFHRWAWAADGRCTDVPYATKIPPAARTFAHPVRERDGAILGWFHPEGAAPTWEVPELEAGTWSAPKWIEMTFELHIQEVAENGVDIAHFLPIHGCGRSSCEILDPKGMPFRFVLRTSYDGDGIGVPGRFVDVSTEWTYWGLGVVQGLSVADEFGVRVLHRFHFTPVPRDRLHFRVAIYADTATTAPQALEFLLRRNAEITRANLEQDAPIWATKRYNPRPVLASGDGALAMVRRWARDFYPAAALPELEVPDKSLYELGVVPQIARIQARRRAELAEASPATVRRVFAEKIPQDFRPGVAPRAFVVQYDVTGDAPAAWWLEVDAERCRANEGRHATPDVTVTVDANDWIGIHAGRLDAAQAFMSGKLQVAGDFELAARLGEVFPLA